MKSAGIALLLVVVLCACAKTTATSLVAGQPAGERREFGKTVVLTWFAFEETGKGGREKAARLRSLINARLRALPGLTPGDEGAFIRELGEKNWRDASDTELVAAARAGGADSVVVLEVAKCGGSFNIHLPPSWNVETSFAYRARLLDVRSGSLILSAMRGRDADKPFALRGREALYQDFETDLAELTQPLVQANAK